MLKYQSATCRRFPTGITTMHSVSDFIVKRFIDNVVLDSKQHSMKTQKSYNDTHAHSHAPVCFYKQCVPNVTSGKSKQKQKHECIMWRFSHAQVIHYTDCTCLIRSEYLNWIRVHITTERLYIHAWVRVYVRTEFPWQLYLIIVFIYIPYTCIASNFWWCKFSYQLHVPI